MVLHVQPFCGFFTKIYDSVFDEGAPVVYADFYGFACSKGLNEHFAREEGWDALRADARGARFLRSPFFR